MNNSDLLSASNEAIASGDNARGLLALRKFNLNNTDDAAAWHRQALLEEQIGDWNKAGHAHHQCISLAPNNVIGYLYLGAWLKGNNQLECAAAAFSLAQSIDPNSLALWRSPDISDPTRKRSRAGDELLRRFLSDQHRTSVANSPKTSPVGDSIWTRTHDKTVKFNEPLFSPELFFIPGVYRKPIYKASEFTWATGLIEQFDSIKLELASVLNENGNEVLRPYLPQELVVDGDLQGLAGSLNWSALDLYKDGILNQKIAERFPVTLSALEKIPTYGLDETPFEVFFSILKPGQTIAPHFGQSNHSLNVHLPIKVPEQCYLSVANERHQWEPGELLIFDDSYLHSAHNESKEARIVLIFSIWHPSLSAKEQGLVQNCFRVRKQWLDSRLALLTESKAALC